jgi:hypothetical protein
VDDVGEAAVLALDENTRVQEHVHQEAGLAFCENECGDRLDALGVRELDSPRSGSGGRFIPRAVTIAIRVPSGIALFPHNRLLPSRQLQPPHATSKRC